MLKTINEILLSERKNYIIIDDKSIVDQLSISKITKPRKVDQLKSRDARIIYEELDTLYSIIEQTYVQPQIVGLIRRDLQILNQVRKSYANQLQEIIDKIDIQNKDRPMKRRKLRDAKLQRFEDKNAKERRLAMFLNFIDSYSKINDEITQPHFDQQKMRKIQTWVNETVWERPTSEEDIDYTNETKQTVKSVLYQSIFQDKSVSIVTSDMNVEYLLRDCLVTYCERLPECTESLLENVDGLRVYWRDNRVKSHDKKHSFLSNEEQKWELTFDTSVLDLEDVATRRDISDAIYVKLDGGSLNYESRI